MNNDEKEFEGTSYPRLCALLGSTPSRLSQSMHNAGFRTLSIPFSYVAFDTERTEVALTAMRVLGIRGFSLTIPHKEKALSLVDALSEEAAKIGAINTVIKSHRHLVAHNTDHYGISESISRAGVPVESVVVYGAGGAARAALFALKQLGASEIYVCNRTASRAEELATIFGVSCLKEAELQRTLESRSRMFINASPVGMPHLSADFPFDAEVFTEQHVVFDMLLKKSALLERAVERGAETIPGIEMLYYQGIKQFELFTGCEAPASEMRQALEAEFERI